MAISLTQVLVSERLSITDARPVGLHISPSSRTNQDINNFFKRNGFARQAQQECNAFACSRYPDAEIAPVASQGYCSYTLALAKTHLLQFRPEAYKLDLSISDQARTIFKTRVPQIKYVGSMPATSCPAASTQGQARLLHVYLQDRIPGIPLSEFQKTKTRGDKDYASCQQRLIEDLADMFALSFHRRRRPGVDAGLGNDPSFEKGQIGTSLRWRLNMLESLPDKFLQETVAKIQSEIDRIESSPWCLTHGDLVPANIIVDPDSGHLTGLIDWAEGEWLPLGVGLYGLEEVLGEDDPLRGFQFYDNHEELRELFWDRLLNSPKHGLISESSQLLHLDASRTLGILLWRGIAFENGRIDRVVEAGRDDDELRKLQLFLKVSNPQLIKAKIVRDGEQSDVSHTSGLSTYEETIVAAKEFPRQAGVA
ncbi:hypothetical protein G7046_g10122 [Stylonectria norvegica]|nr:hypothetical protein G7046_g10122 [Stylonectria norvegica]